MSDYYVAQYPTKRSVYHVKEDCKRIKYDSIEKPKRFVEWHELEICKWCDPSRDSPFDK